MSVGLFELMTIGLLMIVSGVSLLLMMVHGELGPVARLGAGGRWLLAGALGMGVIAFAVKLTAIAVMAGMPQKVIAPLVGELQPTGFVGLEPDGERPDETSDAGARYVWQALPERAPAPADNPTTAEKVALGRRLFEDRRLSRDGTLSCSSCHTVAGGGAGIDGRRTATGIDGQVGPRNVPTVWNTAFQAVLFWDGRAASLEEQAAGPMLNPIEMGMPSAAAVEARVNADAGYREAFARAFGDDGPVTMKRIVAAIAAYERTLITPDTPYDRFVRGDRAALTPAQLRGMALFQATGCIGCHAGPNFSGASLFEGQAPLRTFPTFASAYEARYDLAADSGAAGPGRRPGTWRIPSLRNVALTAPYFHNGSVKDLREAVRIMATVQLGKSIGAAPTPPRLVVWAPSQRVLGSVVQGSLSETDVDDIVAFLDALTGDSLARAAN